MTLAAERFDLGREVAWGETGEWPRTSEATSTSTSTSDFAIVGCAMELESLQCVGSLGCWP